MQEDIQKLSTVNDEKEKRINSLTLDGKQNQDQIQKQQKEIEQLNESNALLNKQCAIIQEELQKAQQNIKITELEAKERIKYEQQQFNQQLNQVQSQNFEKILQLNQEYENEVQQLQDTIKKTEKEIEILQNQLINKREIENQVKQIKEENNNSKILIQELVNDIDDLKNQLKQSQFKNSNLENQLKVKNEQLESLDNKQKNENQGLQVSNKQQIDDLTRQIENLKDKNDKQEKNINALASENINLQQRLFQLENNKKQETQDQQKVLQLIDIQNKQENQLQQKQAQDNHIKKPENLNQIFISPREEIIKNPQYQIPINQNQQDFKAQEINIQQQLKQIYPRKSLNTYVEEYKHIENIKKVVLELQQKFDSFRSVRGDGNCYFRAVGFSYLEHLLRYTTPLQHLEDFINKLESDRGYYQVRPNNINNSHQILKQTFLRLLNNLKELKEQNQKFLQKYLVQELENNKDKQDEALVWQMRCLTANYLESHREYYESFCQTSYEELIRNVLTMGKEADGLGVGPLQVVLKVKIDIVTIDRNYAEALQFEQMKIAGKCPQIFILYKPGYYDIIYSKEQSNVDGFDIQSEQYQERIRLPVNYDIQNPDKPFFVEIPANGQESPIEEFKDFKIKFVVPYKSTEEQSKQQKQSLEQQKIEKEQLIRCQVCQQEIEEKEMVRLGCNHQICKYCLQDLLYQKTGGKLELVMQEKGKKINCQICTYSLSEEEVERIVGREKFEEAKKKASQI